MYVPVPCNLARSNNTFKRMQGRKPHDFNRPRGGDEEVRRGGVRNDSKLSNTSPRGFDMA